MNTEELIEINDKLLKLNCMVVEAIHDILFGTEGYDLIYENTYNEQGNVINTKCYLKIKGTDYDFEISENTRKVLTLIKECRLSYENI